MIVDKITDHVSRALAKMMYQYSSLPEINSVPLATTGVTIQTSNIGAMIALLIDQIQELENQIYAIDEGRLYWDGIKFVASGAQLDGIGELLDIARNGISDEMYLIFITAKIAEDHSTGSTEGILSLIRLLYKAPFIQMFEVFPGEVSFHLTSVGIDVSLFSVVKDIVRQALSAGVNLGFISATSSATVFLCKNLYGPNVGGGFGDYYNPSVGGGFAGLI